MPRTLNRFETLWDSGHGQADVSQVQKAKDGTQVVDTIVGKQRDVINALIEFDKKYASLRIEVIHEQGERKVRIYGIPRS